MRVHASNVNVEPIRIDVARLFVSTREVAFINDIVKELVKDINGQKIFLYQMSDKLTLKHDVYNESVKKAFNAPIQLDCIVDAVTQNDTEVNQFGVDERFKLEVFVQYKDLVDRGIDINVGDFFSFSDIFYEISQVRSVKNIFGQAEHKQGLVLNAIVARDDQFKALLHGPTDIKYSDDDAVQTKFVQQRGQGETSEGSTGDVRETYDVTEGPITGAKEVSERGAGEDGSRYRSSFYSEDPNDD